MKYRAAIMNYRTGESIVQHVSSSGTEIETMRKWLRRSNVVEFLLLASGDKIKIEFARYNP